MATETARYVEELLGGEAPAQVTEDEPEPDWRFRAAVNTLVVDGMDEHTAEALMDSAKARGQDLIEWAQHMVRLRVEYRRKKAS